MKRSGPSRDRGSVPPSAPSPSSPKNAAESPLKRPRTEMNTRGRPSVRGGNGSAASSPKPDSAGNGANGANGTASRKSPSTRRNATESSFFLHSPREQANVGDNAARTTPKTPSGPDGSKSKANGNGKGRDKGKGKGDESAAATPSDDRISNNAARNFAARLEHFLCIDNARLVATEDKPVQHSRRAAVNRVPKHEQTTPRNWCVGEWFYPGIDQGYFFQGEFKQCLARLGLEDVSELTRAEWSYIRRLMGFPRRFSQNFIASEREKLEAVRSQVRSARINQDSGPTGRTQFVLEPQLEAGDPVLILVASADEPGAVKLVNGTFLRLSGSDAMTVNVQSDENAAPVEMTVSDLHVMPLHTPPDLFTPHGTAITVDTLSTTHAQRMGEPLLQLRHLLKTPPAVMLSARSVLGGNGSLPHAADSIGTDTEPVQGDPASLDIDAAMPTVDPINNDDVSLPLSGDQQTNVATLVSLLDRKEALVTQLGSIADKVAADREAAKIRGEASVPTVPQEIRKQFAWIRQQLDAIDSQLGQLLAFARARLDARQARLESLHRRSLAPAQPATPKQAPGADAWFVQLARLCNSEAEVLVEQVSATQRENDAISTDSEDIDPIREAERAKIRRLTSACISLLMQMQRLATGAVRQSSAEPLTSVQVWLALDTALRAMHPTRKMTSPSRNSEETMVLYKQAEARLHDIFPRVMQACIATPPQALFPSSNHTFTMQDSGPAFSSPGFGLPSMLSPGLTGLQTPLGLAHFSHFAALQQLQQTEPGQQHPRQQQHQQHQQHQHFQQQFQQQQQQ